MVIWENPDMVSTALDGIFAFSSLPLRWFAAMGAVISMLGIGYALFVMSLTLYGMVGSAVGYPHGWASLVVAVSFYGGVQLLAIGVLGSISPGFTFSQKADRC